MKCCFGFYVVQNFKIKKISEKLIKMFSKKLGIFTILLFLFVSSTLVLSDDFDDEDTFEEEIIKEVPAEPKEVFSFIFLQNFQSFRSTLHRSTHLQRLMPAKSISLSCSMTKRRLGRNGSSRNRRRKAPRKPSPNMTVCLNKALKKNLNFENQNDEKT